MAPFFWFVMDSGHSTRAFPGLSSCVPRSTRGRSALAEGGVSLLNMVGEETPVLLDVRVGVGVGVWSLPMASLALDLVTGAMALYHGMECFCYDDQLVAAVLSILTCNQRDGPNGSEKWEDQPGALFNFGPAGV